MGLFKSIIVCPHLKGSSNGATCEAALCSAESNLIKNMMDINISMCMSRHFEACHIYYADLKRVNAAYSMEITDGALLSDSRPHISGGI